MENFPTTALRGHTGCQESEKNPPTYSGCMLESEGAPGINARNQAGAPSLPDGGHGLPLQAIDEQEGFERLQILFLIRDRRLTFDEIHPRVRELALIKGWVRKQHHNDTHFIPSGALAEAIGV
jgi:hypothetical protein